MGKYGIRKGVLLLIFLLFNNLSYSEIAQKTYIERGEGRNRSEALRNALYNVLIKCAEEMRWTPLGEEEFKTKFPSPGDYLLGYKIISSRYEDKKVILQVRADVDLKSLREIFTKAGIISRRWTVPKVSMDITSESGCRELNLDEIKNFLTGISKAEFPDYFRETTGPIDYQVKINIKGEEKEMKKISWCLITLSVEINGEKGSVFNKMAEKPVYRFSSEIFPNEVSDFVKKLFVEGVESIERDWEEMGNVIKIVMRTAGWLPLKEIDAIRKLLIQNFSSLSSFALRSESSQNVEWMCTFIGPEEGIIDKIVSLLNSNGWIARKISAEIIEVKKQ